MVVKEFEKLLKKYIVEIGFIILTATQIKLQEAVESNKNLNDWFLDYEQTKESISFAQKTWRNVERNLNLDFDEEVIENTIFLIDRALTEIVKTLLGSHKVKTQNEKAILVALSEAQNNLIFFEGTFLRSFRGLLLICH